MLYIGCHLSSSRGLAAMGRQALDLGANTFQFFTIPIGYFLGGICVDKVFEPYMSQKAADSLPGLLFGTGKGSGAAMLFLILGFIGVITCLIFRKNKHIWALEE